jgi:hypothetical protein
MSNSHLNEIREEGFRLLLHGLGAVGTVQFLRQFENGGGDYTKERETLQEGVSLDDIVARIHERKAREESCIPPEKN